MGEFGDVTSYAVNGKRVLDYKHARKRLRAQFTIAHREQNASTLPDPFYPSDYLTTIGQNHATYHEAACWKFKLILEHVDRMNSYELIAARIFFH